MPVERLPIRNWIAGQECARPFASQHRFAGESARRAAAQPRRFVIVHKERIRCETRYEVR